MDKFLNKSRKRPNTEAAKNQGCERNCLILKVKRQFNVSYKKNSRVILCQITPKNGIQGRAKGHKVTYRKIIFIFFDGEFGIYGKFPLRIWFCDPYGTCRF